MSGATTRDELACSLFVLVLGSTYYRYFRWCGVSKHEAAALTVMLLVALLASSPGVPGAPAVD